MLHHDELIYSRDSNSSQATAALKEAAVIKNYTARLQQDSMHKKRRFPVRISSVNGTKPVEKCRLRNPWWKTSFFRAVVVLN